MWIMFSGSNEETSLPASQISTICLPINTIALKAVLFFLSVQFCEQFRNLSVLLPGTESLRGTDKSQAGKDHLLR